MNNHTIRIGTRGSKLALWQAEEVKTQLNKEFPDLSIEIVIIHTKGDKILDVSLSKIGDKGLFTKEIEAELLNGSIDMAVHSLKDLPTELPEPLILGGILARGEVRDVFLSADGRTLDEMTANDRIATSSLRRQAQLYHLYPHLQVIDIRGNVETRLKKLQSGYCEGLLMAGAGLIRLGLGNHITQFMEPTEFLPAISQGAIGIEVNSSNDLSLELLAQISDKNTTACTKAERAVLRTLEGGCQVPVGCYSELIAKNQLSLTALIASVDGKKLIKESTTCSVENAEKEAENLAQKILDKGGKEILDSLRND